MAAAQDGRACRPCDRPAGEPFAVSVHAQAAGWCPCRGEPNLRHRPRWSLWRRDIKHAPAPAITNDKPRDHEGHDVAAGMLPNVVTVRRRLIWLLPPGREGR